MTDVGEKRYLKNAFLAGEKTLVEYGGFMNEVFSFHFCFCLILAKMKIFWKQKSLPKKKHNSSCTHLN